MEPISLGSIGPGVEDVQRRLTGLGPPVPAPCTAGPDGPPGDPEGEFGPATERSVRAFQQDRGLPSDGVVTEETWAALVAASFRLGDRMLFLTRPMLRGDDVLDLQLRLNRLGFDAGRPDGVFGPATSDALRAFQSEVGLEDDGMLGPASADALARLHRDHHAEPAFRARERAQLRRPARDSLVGARILLDPANGPEVPGNLAADGTAEHELTWAIATGVEGRLTALGAHVLLSRGPRTSPAPEERAALANDADVELVVSIGLNGADSPVVRGATAWYFGTAGHVSERGRRLADLLLDASVAALGVPDCRAHPAAVSILRRPRAVSALVEPGFLTNAEDAALLADPARRRVLSDALADGVAAFLTGGSGRP
jgi:N-acetylmuramoyl-L-alanine amidase